MPKGLAKLASWFDVNAGFGPANRVTLQVETQSLARNWAYHADGTSRCAMHHFDGPANESRADDAVRALSVAGIVEVLMDYHNKKVAQALNPGGSDGDGLSPVCAALFYPEAYYDAAFFGGPFLNTWLQSPGRTDWVATREASDVAIDSYGAPSSSCTGFTTSSATRRATSSRRRGRRSRRPTRRWPARPAATRR